MFIFPRRHYGLMPRLRFVEPPEGDQQQNGGTGGAGGSGKPAEGEPGHVPVKERTPEEQIAFHEAKARRIEETLKGFKGLTPQQVQDAIAERDRLKAETQTETEKAVEKAREEGRNEVRQVLGRERVRSALATALKGRVYEPDALLDFDAGSFVKGDTADADAIKAWVETNTTAAAPGKGPDLGQGKRGPNDASKGVAAGRDLYTSTTKKKE